MKILRCTFGANCRNFISQNWLLEWFNGWGEQHLLEVQPCCEHLNEEARIPRYTNIPSAANINDRFGWFGCPSG